jgi:diacylglycerol kinase (ATP)
MSETKSKVAGTLIKPTSKLLIISAGAGSVTDEVESKLRARFPDFRVVAFNPRHDFRKQITPRARVVVAGGDGTIGFVARALAGSERTLGVLSLGTYNNFARGLGMPEDIDQAIAVIRARKSRRVTLGRANGEPFLEAAAIGMFGEAIALGDDAKAHDFGDLGKDLSAVVGARPFEYTITGDLDGNGRALSLVFANTPSIGARMAVGEKKPRDPFLEVSVRVGASRSDIVGRVLASALLDKHVDDQGMVLKFQSLVIETKPRVDIYADNIKVGRTPLTVSADRYALRVFVP